MNKRFGAGLGEADKVWIDQQRAAVLDDDGMRAVALHNDRTRFELVLEDRVKELVVERQEKNGTLFDMFFQNAAFHDLLLGHLAETYDEFRRRAAGVG